VDTDSQSIDDSAWDASRVERILTRTYARLQPSLDTGMKRHYH